jgi:hypothetical protein
MKTLIKTAIALVLISLNGLKACAQGGYGEIRGIIKNTDLEPVPFATVKILQGNLLVGGTQTDMDGRYKYKPLTPGSYEMVVIEPGHATQQINKIAVIPNEATYVDVKLQPHTLGTFEVVAAPIDYSKTGVDKNMYSMKSIDATELMQNASYSRGDIKGAMSSLTSEVIETNGENHFRGARGDASGYFVDGVRTVNVATVPGLAIENLTFFSGGVPAMYGDLTSGAIMITTKSYFSGIRDKNMRLAYEKEKTEARKAAEKAKLDEENRKKEIEQEKLMDKQKQN